MVHTKSKLNYMKRASRRRVTITLPPELLQRIDEQAKRSKDSRTAVIEAWVRAGAHQALARAIEEDTIAYYKSLTAEERAEDEAMVRAFSDAAKRIDYDGPPPRARRGKRRR